MAALPERRELLIPVVGIADVTHLKLSVRHEAGGINYFDYKHERKGVYIGFQPMTVERTEYGSVERFTAFTGMKFLLEETTRMDRKKVAKHADRIFPMAEALAARWFARDFEGIRTEIGGLPAEVAKAS